MRRPFARGVRFARVSEPIVVEVRRNGVVEAGTGCTRWPCGTARWSRRRATPRSRASCAPRRSRSRRCRSPARATTSTTRDLAIASASHRATDDQIAAVRALLAKAPATEDDLELGPQEGRPPEQIFHNCSGKHAGHARALPGARLADRRATACPSIPVQQACLDAHAEAAERRAGGARTTAHRRLRRRHLRAPARADGACLLALRAAARRRARRRRDARASGSRRRPGRRRLPPDARRARLVREGRRRRARSAPPAPTASASRSSREDGASRPLAPALAAFLAPLGVDLPDLATVPVCNSRGERVGEHRRLGVTTEAFLYEPVTPVY